MSEPFPFMLAEGGMTRFPPNIEQITVDVQSTRAWLVARRNDTELRFPLSPGECRHLAGLLLAAADGDDVSGGVAGPGAA